MRCTSCDSEITPGALICGACGAPVTGTVQPTYQAEPVAPEVPVEQDAPGDWEIPAPPETPAPAPVEPRPAAGAVPEIVEPFRSSYSSSGERIMGMPTDVVGNVALGLGGAGCLLIPFGCGWIFSILGLVVGFLGLKTSGRRNAIIGLVLGALALIITLVALCGIIGWFVYAIQGSSGFPTQ